MTAKRQALQLQYFTVGWNVVEGVIAIGAGVLAGSITLVSVCWGRFLFPEPVPVSTWVGIVLIILGGCVIQFGHGSQ